MLRLMGYWPHDINHDLGAWSFGLPDDLARLVYPQCGRFDHMEMAMNLDVIVLGPGWEVVNNIEGLVCPYGLWISYDISAELCAPRK